MLASNFVKMKNKVIIGAYSGTMRHDIQAKGIGFEYIPFNINNINLFSILQTYLKIIQIIRTYNIQIIHSHHRWLELIVFLTQPFHSSRIFMTCHNLLFGKKFFSYRSPKIIAVSNSVIEHLYKYFNVDKGKMALIRNAPRLFPKVSREEILQCKKNILNFDSRLVIGGFGRLHKEKGFDVLLEALVMAAQNGCQFNCLIAGDGPERNNLESQAIENELMIKFLGEVRDLGLYYSICDIIVIPSRKESSSLIALEAASFKKPIIVSNIGGLREIVIDRVNGLTFEYEQSQELYEAIISYMLNDDLRNRCGENLYNLLIELYSVEKMIKKTELVYNAVHADN
ncbi:glycosyltransferase family 4 protein [bacterium]|nr:glycosyltransferase family 4 protein [bacterium]